MTMRLRRRARSGRLLLAVAVGLAAAAAADRIVAAQPSCGAAYILTHTRTQQAPA